MSGFSVLTSYYISISFATRRIITTTMVSPPTANIGSLSENAISLFFLFLRRQVLVEPSGEGTLNFERPNNNRPEDLGSGSKDVCAPKAVSSAWPMAKMPTGVNKTKSRKDTFTQDQKPNDHLHAYIQSPIHDNAYSFPVLVLSRVRGIPTVLQGLFTRDPSTRRFRSMTAPHGSPRTAPVSRE